MILVLLLLAILGVVAVVATLQVLYLGFKLLFGGLTLVGRSLDVLAERDAPLTPWERAGEELQHTRHVNRYHTTDVEGES